MEEAALYIRQSIKWTGGLLAIWLLMLLPARAAKTESVTERQTYVSPASAQHGASESGISLVMNSYGSIALVSQRVGFSFLPSLVFWPWLLSALYRALGVALPGRFYNAIFSFGFLRPFFEHQIAINAP